MSVATRATAGAAFLEGPVFPLTVGQYHELMDAGILASSDPVELLEGVLVQKMSIKPAHARTVGPARDLLKPLRPDGWRYRADQPVSLGDGEPEPDGGIARGRSPDNFRYHPPAAEVVLVIEVADATLARDRGIKRRSYARAGIPVYWLINLIDCQVEVYADPDPAAVPEPTYRRRDVYAGGAAVPLAVPGREPSSIPAALLLPPA